MSGVVALIAFDGTPVSREDLARLAGPASYRGEDGFGTWLGPSAGLGQQLLRATPSELPEPLVDGELVVAADARLDNRPELLAAFDELDAGAPDVALLAAAYRHWGPTCAARLIGDFAFVIWDRRARRLVAARDPMAMRSLAFHFAHGRRLTVASEVAQVLADPTVSDSLDERAIAADLAGHFGEPDWTPYRDVRLLGPGEVLLADASGLWTRRAWTPTPEHRVVHRTWGDYAEHLRDVFVEAVAARLRSPHAAGVLLSGGVDSGSVASAAGLLIERGDAAAPRLHAATWAFDELTQCDERSLARVVADRYGASLDEVPADHAGPLASFPAHGPPRDEPFVGAFQPLIDRSLEALRFRDARVVLGGDRGDLVIGPAGFRLLPLARQRRWRELRSELDEHRGVTAEGWPHLLWWGLLGPALSRVVRRARRGLATTNERPTAPLLPPWIRPDFAARTGLHDLVSAPRPAPAGFGPARGLRHDYVFTRMHMRGMAWSERTYAARGLVFADPFSDRRVVELVLAMPQTAIHPPGRGSKPLMREAMRGIVPEPARRGATKTVPQPLFERALKRDASATVRHLLSSMAAAERGWIDERALREHYEQWRRGGRLRPEFWWAISVEWWLRDHAA